jgi:hypothetical protein
MMPAILNRLPTAVRLKGPSTTVVHHTGHGDLDIAQSQSVPTTDDVTLAGGTVSQIPQSVWDANAQSPLVLNHTLIQVG